MMLSSSCFSVLVHCSLEVRSSWYVSPFCVSHATDELGIVASCPCPSSPLPLPTAWPNLCPLLAHVLLYNAVAYCFPWLRDLRPFVMRRCSFCLTKLSFNYIDCSWRELAMFPSPLSHSRQLCCCQQSLWDPTGLNFSPARYSLEVHLYLLYVLIDSEWGQRRISPSVSHFCSL